MSSENEKQKAGGFRTYLNFVDSTRFFTTPFSWLYVILALGFLATPILVLLTGIDFGIFNRMEVNRDGQMVKVLADGQGKLIFAFILTVIASIFAAIVSFVVAWNGRKKMSTNKITIELIIDAVADLQALTIKSVAHFIGIFGFFTGLFALIFGPALLNAFGIIDLLDGFGLGTIITFAAVAVMVISVLYGYAMVWISRLYKFLFEKLMRIFVMVIVQIFKFVVLHAIVVIYKFIAHIVRQLFDYVFIAVQAIVDLIVNGLKVVIALVARLGRFLLAYARSPFKNRDYNDAKITYNE